LGAAFGSLLAGPLSDTYGRKKAIIVCDILFTIGALLMGLASSISMLIFGRFIVGVSQLHF
jgi:MFS family permease